MNRLRFLMGIVLACALSAFAHQPRLVRDQPSIMVRNAEISQASFSSSASPAPWA
jgi:hypothetical protein